MRARAAVAVFIVGAALAACSTPYQESGSGLAGGGYESQRLDSAIWRVSFGGNGYTTRETAQTYWLYRCAELTLEQGFDGFEILSNVRLSEGAARPLRLATATPMFIPMRYGTDWDLPLLVGDIHLLRKPFEAAPPKTYDAAELKKTLETYVTGEKCSGWNVCRHAHSYLDGTRDDPAKSATTH
jgi:hypothetical protein